MYLPKIAIARQQRKRRPGFQDTAPVAKSSLAALPAPLGVEQSDDCPRVIIALNSKWRVIACPNALQWILQRRQGKRWRGYWFCRTREALIRGAREHTGTIGGDALVILLRLPERFPVKDSGDVS